MTADPLTTGLRDGERIGGRYLVTANHPSVPGRFLVRDPVRPSVELELALWPVPAADWGRARAHIGDLARLRHPSLVRLGDFGRHSRLGLAFALTRRVGDSEESTPELRAAALRTSVELTVGMHGAGLPFFALRPERARYEDGRALFSALELVVGGADGSESMEAWAESMLGASELSRDSRRMVEAIQRSPGTSTAGRRIGGLAKLQSTAVADELSALLRDLRQAGRGAVVLLHGEEVAEQLERFRPQVRADDLPLVELDLTLFDDVEAALAELVRQLAEFIPTGFLWRHGSALKGLVPELAGNVGEALDSGRALSAALSLLDEVSVAHPTVIRLQGVGGGRPYVTKFLQHLVTPNSREPGGASRLILVEPRGPGSIDEMQIAESFREMTLGRVAAVREPRTVRDDASTAGARRPAAGSGPRDREEGVDGPATHTVDAAGDDLYEAVDQLVGRREWGRVFDLLERSSDVASGSIAAARVEAMRALALAGSGATMAALESAAVARRSLRRDAPVGHRIEVSLALGRASFAARDAAGADANLRQAIDLLATDERSAKRYGPIARVLEGDIEAERGRPERAAAAYSMALSVAVREASSSAVVAARLGTARCLLADGETAAAEGVLRLMLSDAVRGVAPIAPALVRFELGRSALANRRHTAAAQEIRSGLDEVGDEDPVLHDRLQVLSARVMYESGDAHGAVVALERLADGSSATGDRALEVLVRAQLAEALALDGSAKRAEVEARQALAAARGLEQGVAEGIALRAMAVAAGARKSIRAGVVEQRFVDSLALFDQLGCGHEASATLTRLRSFLVDHPEVRVASNLVGRVAAASDPAGAQLVSGDVERDQRNLMLMAATLREEDDIDVILGRIATAADASWVAVVRGGEPTADATGNEERIVHSLGPVPPDLGTDLVIGGDPGALRSGVARRYALDGGRLIACQPVGASPALWLVYETYEGRRSPSGIIAALAAPIAGRLAPDSTLGVAEASGDEHGLVGETPVMRRLRAAIDRLARSDLPVLVVGESGTGKELLARAIHRAAPDRRGPFVPIDCGAIPESLIETELFGHRQGAFTGTTRDRAGLFEEASGGTAFLDQVTNIPKTVQAKLLRVLQEGEVRRVGDTAVRKIDARVIAASNRPLEAAVHDGEFREDLYFRLHVVEIEVPPLRERREDIPLIAAHLLARLGEPRPVIEPAAMDRLLSYDWPGNVRELENELRRATAVASGRRIRTVDLSGRVRGSRELVLPEAAKLRDAVESLERRLLKEALLATRGHRGKTARMLGLSHQGLLNKIRKYDLLYFPARGGLT